MGIRSYLHGILILIYVGYTLCEEKVSLTFVIDNTLSMKDDINQVKLRADEITKNVFEEKSSQIKNMVLVTFNDPYAKVETVTQNRNEFKRIINNIRVQNPYGNWDCEEPSMNGIITGLKNSLPGSYIYVFTDASAKDYTRSVEIKNMCQKMQSQVVFVLTGYCYKTNSIDFFVYYDIATACSGLVFYVTKSDVHKVLEPITQTITGNKTLLTAVTTPAYRYTDIPFVIDDQTEYAIVTASGIDVALRVRGPSSVQHRLLWLVNAKSIKLSNTTPGKYVATVMGHTETSVNIIARTDFIFSHGFSKLEPKSISDTTKQPIADAKTHLSISVTDQKHTVNIKSAQILDMHEKVLQTLSLKRVGNDFYTTQPFVAPSQRFKVAILGNAVTDGKEIRRIAKIPVTPQEPPVVLPDPKSPVLTIPEGRQTEVIYGSTVKLTCKVSAYPAPKITWRNSQGATIVSQSAVVEPPYEYISYVTISDVIDRDSYTCYAESAGHPARDKSVVVTVKEPFDVKSAIQGTTELQYGKSGTLKCDVRSSVPIHIYWNYEEAKGKTIRVQTSDKYTISADGKQLDVKKMDLDLVGTYSCIAYVQKDPRKIVAFSTQVKIGGVARPTVTGNAEEKVLKGSNIDIKCHITGAPTPIITWQFMSKDGLNFVSIPFSDNVLRLRNVDVKDAGKYKCIANNVFGNGDHVTVLTVQVPPTITSHTLVVKGVEGKDGVLTIPCLATGLPKPVISWKKGGVTITPSPKYYLDGDTLVIKDPKVSDSRKYRCEAKNDAGSVYETFEAEILQSPKLSGKTEITVKSGESVEIICNIVKGVPRPAISWKFMAKGDTKFVSLSASDNVLRISSIDKKNDGRYKCVATNTVSKDEHITTVNVEFAPIITKHSKPYKGIEGDVALKIACDVIGLPKPVITYKLNGAVITPGIRYNIVDGALIIKDPKNSDSNKTYTCEAKNYLGSDDAKFAVEVDANLEDYGTVSRLDVLGGTAKKLECLLADPKQPVRWFNEGIVLNITTKYLTLNNIDVVKEGNYSCRVSDINGGRTYTYEVIVGYSPTFSSEQDDPVFDWTGSRNDMLDCTFNAKPPAKIVWTFNGKVLSDQTPSLPVSGNWGHYTCNVSNVHGAVQKTFDVTSSNCLIPRQLTNHATSTMPLILTTDFTWPVVSGTEDYLIVNTGETLIFSCPHQKVKNSFLKLPTVNEISATCDKQNIFKVNGKPYPVSHLICTNEVKSIKLKKEGKCLTESSELIRVGYDIHGFLETYDVCLDISKKLPLYARVLMSKSNRGKGLTIFDWHKYPGIDNEKEVKYSCKGSNSSCCYRKTQLVNARDFLYGPAQRSTFIDPLNAVPYWNPCEKAEDPWTSLENDIRTLLSVYDQFISWSGTHGLQEKDGVMIPRYLWKVVKFDDEQSIAIVYVNGQSFSHDDILCKNICPDAGSVLWLKLVKNTYCCEVNEFLRAFGLRGTTVGVK